MHATVHLCRPPLCPADAYGLVLRHEEGWSLVYSGDTQPCQQLVQVRCAAIAHCKLAKRPALCMMGVRKESLHATPHLDALGTLYPRRATPMPRRSNSHIPLPHNPPSLQAGRGCSLLIHEATFEPCLEQQARAKRHSTTAEALEVAQVGSWAGGWAAGVLRFHIPPVPRSSNGAAE